MDNDHPHSSASLPETRRRRRRRVSGFVGDNRHSVLLRFGKAVANRRHQLGLTQVDIAMRTGFSRSSISEIECGRENVSLERAEELAQALDCPLSTLLQE